MLISTYIYIKFLTKLKRDMILAFSADFLYTFSIKMVLSKYPINLTKFQYLT